MLAQQVIVVTGGGSGIGRCIAHELASLGAHVAIIGRTPKKLNTVIGEITEDGGSASMHSLDIRDEAAVIETVDAIVSGYGRIDGLVNNAGGQYRAPLREIDPEGLRGGGPHQPDRWLHRDARGLQPLDG